MFWFMTHLEWMEGLSGSRAARTTLNADKMHAMLPGSTEGTSMLLVWPLPSRKNGWQRPTRKDKL
jgi:hypothetical protein